MIETSKGLYRPEEEIQFSVLTFNRWLRPVEEVFEKIWIENAKGLKVMQWQNTRSTGGLISLKFPIAKVNTFGVWKVKVVTSNDQLVEKSFRVDVEGNKDNYDFMYLQLGSNRATNHVRCDTSSIYSTN